MLVIAKQYIIYYVILCNHFQQKTFDSYDDLLKTPEFKGTTTYNVSYTTLTNTTSTTTTILLILHIQNRYFL